MRIVKLTAENLLRLKAVEIEPDGNVVTISGKNAAGKTSVLNAISLALGGKAAAKGTTRPVRDGESHAEVVVDLGDIVVTRTWTADGHTSLRVENGDRTSAYRSPQALLDGLVGRLSFDPLAFAEQSDKDQLATLLSLVDLPFDPDELDAQRRSLYEERTLIGREKRQLEGQLAGLPEIPAGLPEHEVSASDLINRIQAAREQARRTDEAMTRVSQARDRVKLLEQELAAAQAELASAEAALSTVPRPVDVAALEDQLATVEDTNAAVRAAAQRRDVEARLSDAVRRYEAYTDDIAAIDQAKAEGIAAAAMPIDGLGFDEDGVTYQGVPFRQCSAAERLRVSIAIAAAMNPDIRVIRVTDASLLDSDSMRLIEEMANERDLQVWLEVVSDDANVGIHIEDGTVVTPTEVTT